MEQKVIRYRHNVIKVNSIEAFGNITGGMRRDGTQHGYVKDVYFVKALGMGAHYFEELQKLDNMMSQRKQGMFLYKRMINALPVLAAEEAVFYGICYDKWKESQKKRIETRLSVKNTELAEILGCAMADAVEKFKVVKPNMSESIEKNYVVKLAFWFDAVMGNFLENWKEECCIKMAVHNVAKEQEYLFYYMLTLVGIDVLLLQNKADIPLPQKLKELSTEFCLGPYGDVELPLYIEHTFKNRTENAIKMVLPPRPGRKTEPPSQQTIPRVQIPRHETESARNAVQQAPSQQTPPHVQIPRHASESARRVEKSFEELALLASSVVMITVHDKSGKPFASGSGIMIGKAGYILTNHHVASDGSFYSVMIEGDDKSYPTTEIIKYNPVLDLSVIRIDRTLAPLPVYNGTKKPVRGQKVIAIGSPLGFFNTVSDGIISGFRVMNNVDVIQHTAPVAPGSSGGALLNMYGEVIGIVTALIDEGQNMNIAVSYEYINLFVKGFV